MGERLDNHEAELVRLAKNGDTAAMRSLYDAHAQYLFSVCRRYAGDDQTAADILQESLIKIFTSLGKFSWRGPGSLRAWMKRITVNESLMALRKAHRLRIEDSGGELPDVAEEPQVEDIPMAELQRMIRDLPDGYRTVFNLYVLEGLSHKDIASILGISENTSYSQFSRAKAILSKQIREYRKSNE